MHSFQTECVGLDSVHIRRRLSQLLSRTNKVVNALRLRTKTYIAGLIQSRWTLWSKHPLHGGRMHWKEEMLKGGGHWKGRALKRGRSWKGEGTEKGRVLKRGGCWKGRVLVGEGAESGRCWKGWVLVLVLFKSSQEGHISIGNVHVSSKNRRCFLASYKPSHWQCA